VLLSGNVYAIVINIFGNFFIFMPLQFFLIELFEIRKIKQNFLVCFTITFVIEIVQYIFKVGMLDVDDILLCVAGMMSFYYFYGKYRGKNKKRGM
jgi:glycopeptide antibiotics resistance protein